MKFKYAINILYIALVFALCGCANEIVDDSQSNDTFNHVAASAAANTQEQADENEQTNNSLLTEPFEQILPVEPVEPIEPITPIEPIEDYELPSIHEGIYFSFYSMEDIFAFFEIMPHLSKDSEAHATLQTAEFYDCATYYLPNPEKVPDGYELIYANISPEAASFSYSSTPENYQEYPWYWPDETSWRCDISFEWYETNRVIYINSEPVRFADDYVIPYKIGTNDHVTE